MIYIKYISALLFILSSYNSLSYLSGIYKKSKSFAFRPIPVQLTSNQETLFDKIEYPTTIKNVVTSLTKNIQNSLQNRKSRIEIELPPGADFGVENAAKTESKKSDAAPSAEQIKKSNRESARLITEMFAVLSSTTVVLFPTEDEARIARNLWGSKFKGQVLSMDVKASKGYGKLRSRRFSAEEQEQALMATDGIYVPDETEVLILAGPRAKDIKKLKKINEKFGDGTLIILLNARLQYLSNRLKIDEEKENDIDWIESSFINVFNYAPPVLKDSIKKDILLFHQYNSKWYLAEKLEIEENNKGFLDSIASIATGKKTSKFNTIWQGDNRPSSSDIESLLS